MKTIKIMLEYGCYPVWVYGPDGLVEDNALPKEFADDVGLDGKFQELQDQFDATFINAADAFEHKGFSSQNEEEVFYRDLQNAVEDLKRKCLGRYCVEDRSRDQA